ncbi:hypothetical protein ACLOJK_023494 [Asimina triloba]
MRLPDNGIGAVREVRSLPLPASENAGTFLLLLLLLLVAKESERGRRGRKREEAEQVVELGGKMEGRKSGEEEDGDREKGVKSVEGLRVNAIVAQTHEKKEGVKSRLASRKPQASTSSSGLRCGIRRPT